MPFNALITLALLVAVLSALVFTRYTAETIMLLALVVLLVTRVLTPVQALEGFSNPGIHTIAALYVVAAGLKESGAVQWLSRNLLGQPQSLPMAQLRLLIPTALLSAFMNNTAVVAMFIPAVQNWAQRLGISISKLLIPLSYAAILGGTCTLIGTSTNLVVNGLLQHNHDIHLGLFEIAKIGLPLLLIGGLYLVFFISRLLPSNGLLQQRLDDEREYGVAMEVLGNGPIAGKSITLAGLRALQYGYLAEIERQGALLAAVDPEQVIQAGDTLYFIGAPECASELRSIQGLVPASGSIHKLEAAHHQRCIVEVVVGSNFPYLGSTIKESRFRNVYNAVVLSVARDGKRTPGKLGNIQLKLGDALLLETSQRFVEQHRSSRDFLLLSALNDSTPPNFTKAPTALSILALMVLLVGTGLIPLLQGGMLAAVAMISSGCLTLARARSQIDISVLLVMACSLAMGTAISTSGLTDLIVIKMMSMGLESPFFALVLVYALTICMTEVITNIAAAILVFPLATSLAGQLDISLLPFAIAVMVGASMSFMTPFGYQTNIMVYGPGRYKFSDYLKAGIPLSLLMSLGIITLIPVFWPF
jgi:di/tricarboxylate transporter